LSGCNCRFAQSNLCRTLSSPRACSSEKLEHKIMSSMKTKQFVPTNLFTEQCP
jgi:hypothetical protein